MIRIANAIIGIVGVLALASAAPAQEAAAPTPQQITEAWLASPHADSTAEAFRHWDDEGEVPGSCAVCHSTTGFVDYLKSDRTAAAMIDHPVPLGTTVECAACHDPAAAALSQGVVFPSGEVVTIGDSSAVCTVCHQGRASGDTVNAAVAGLDLDTVAPDLGFINVHYSAAASTLMGSAARGGYEYPGLTYAGQFAHVPTLNTCTSCHEAHTTEVAPEPCAVCHAGAADYLAIRTTLADIDGDGDVTEGMGHVIAGLNERLYATMQSYAAEVGGAPIVYDDHAYPYFFADTDGDGQVGEGEAIFLNAYKAWTPRLLQAAYNFQFVGKDGGAYVHNPHYVAQLLVDSIQDLSGAMGADASDLVRP